jgi:hypothetical protein
MNQEQEYNANIKAKFYNKNSENSFNQRDIKKTFGDYYNSGMM